MTNRETAFTIRLSAPPVEIQQEIVAGLEEALRAEEEARRLKAKMEAKIRATIDRVWGRFTLAAGFFWPLAFYLGRTKLTTK